MRNGSRIEKTIKNTVFNMFNQIVSICLQFVLRTVFIQCLALEYLGINGLFSNILTMLSLTELGLGTAIVCSLYKPLAEKNESEIRKYFYIYKKVYTIIGAVIFIIGMAIVPFLNYFVKDAYEIPDLKIIYILFLMDSVASYFFAQYRVLLGADQKDYVNANNRTLFLIIQTALQIVILYIFHNYILYMIVKIVCNLLSSYVISIKVKKIYPFIQQKSHNKLSIREMKTIKNDTEGVFVSKIGMTVLNSTDNIIISSFIGSVMTAYYSNYSMLIGTISTAMGLIFSSVQASIGNYCNLNGREESKLIFLNIQYVYFCIYGFATICLTSLVTPFITIWLGEKFVLMNRVVIVMALNFYLSNARQIVLNFLVVNHLTIYLRLKTLIEILINLAVSIFLVTRMGIIGVFIGTSVSLVTTSLWYEPYILYKKYFNAGVTQYYLRMLQQSCMVIVGVFLAQLCTNYFFKGTIMSFGLCCIIVVIIAGITVTIPFFKTREFYYLLDIIKRGKR